MRFLSLLRAALQKAGRQVLLISQGPELCTLILYHEGPHVFNINTQHDYNGHIVSQRSP